MSNVVALPVRGPTRLLTKRELARELGRSPRWVELRMRDGMPVQPRTSPREHARFDLVAVKRWLEDRATSGPEKPLQDRVAYLEQRLEALEARLSA